MTRQFNLKTSFDRNPRRTPPPESLKTCEAIVARVGETGQPLIFEDALKDARYEQLNGPEVSRKNQSRFFAAFPIKSMSTTVGTLVCIGAAPRKLDSNEMDFLEAITGQIALALENTELRDLLGKKNLELQVIAADLARKSVAQSQIISFVSREIRTYLNVVIGSVELLQHQESNEANEDRKDTLKTIASESWQLLERLGALLQAIERNAP
jgi:GAF domain-containing protein